MHCPWWRGIRDLATMLAVLDAGAERFGAGACVAILTEARSDIR